MKRNDVVALLALVIVTILVYLPALPGEFQFDDEAILRSAQVRDLRAFASSHAWSLLARPLTTFTFAVDHAVHGFDTRGWHATSLALHVLAVVLAWRLAQRVMSRAGVPHSEAAALCAAAFFALHPIQTEAVSYLSQRAEVLAALFTLSGILLLLALDGASRPGNRAALVAGAIATQAVGLAAKQTAAVVPALWLAIVALVPAPDDRDRSPWRRLAIRIPVALPLVALSALAAFWSLAGTRGSPHAGLEVPNASWSLYVATEVRAIPRYLSLLLWPAGQNVYWDMRFSTHLAEPRVVASTAFLAALVALALLASRSRHAGAVAAGESTAALGAVSFLVALSPTLLVPLADPFAEHRAYLATLWFAIGVVGGGSALLGPVASRRSQAVVVTCAFGVVAALATATALRNEVWRTELALWRDAAAKSPDKGPVHTNLCRALVLAGETQAAVAACDRAVDLGDVPEQEQVPLRYLALALMKLNRIDEARERILSFAGRSPLEGDTLAVLAKIELTAGRAVDAERYGRDGIARDGAPRAYVVLGEVLESRGDLAGAASAYAQAVRREPGEALALMALGRVQERRGMLQEACDAYARAADGPPSAFVPRARARLARLRCQP